MQIKNTDVRYGVVAILLHWLMALLVIGLLMIGLYMADLPFSMQKLTLYGWHKETGILVLMLAVQRIIWRLANVVPALPLTMPLWQKFAARAAHYAFYGFIVVMPLSGWCMSSAAGLPVSFFGLFVLPDLVPASESLRALFNEVHVCLAYALITLICIHTLAALWHHFIDKDDVLRKML